MSSLTRQIHLLKAFRLFALVTGDGTYGCRSDEIFRLHTSVFLSRSNLLPWGGHVFLNPNTLRPDGPPNKGMQHELKDSFPDYDALYRIDPPKTLRMIRAMWAAHADDGGDLIVSRHASAQDIGDFQFEQISALAAARPGPPAASERLTFMNASNDLIFAALKYYEFTGDIHALRAAESLYQRYIVQRSERTGLGVYMYTVPLQRMSPEEDTNTMSWFGDRASRQLGPELGADALELNVLLDRQVQSIYGELPWMLMCLRRQAGAALDVLCHGAVTGLEAFCKGVLVGDGARCRPMLATGVDLTGFVLARDGYYGPSGERLTHYATPPKVIAAVLLAALHFNSPTLRSAANRLFAGLGLGTTTSDPIHAPVPNYFTRCAEPSVALFLIEAYSLTGQDVYLRLAECVVDRMLRASWYPPFFQRGIASRYACFDAVEPLVVAQLLATASGVAAEPSLTSSSSIYGEFRLDDGRVVTVFDNQYFRNALR